MSNRLPKPGKLIAGMATAAVCAAMLTGCSSGGGATQSAAHCTNKIVHANAPKVTVWSWYPSFEDVVDQFNTTHTDVQACWTNVGSGTAEYDKLTTAVESGKGAPDVVMLEDEVLPSFELRKALVDLTAYGANGIKKNYSAGAWKDVSSGNAVYAVPVDGGPMGLYYRADILKKYHIAVPTTWAEFKTAGEKLKAAGGPAIADFPTNGNGYLQGLFQQAGTTAFSYDVSSPKKISIDINSASTKKVLDFWGGLVKEGVVTTEDSFSTDWSSKLAKGGYATFPAAAWGLSVLTGLTNADPKAEWRAAPLPQWDPSNPVQVNYGGSTFAVTSQAADKKNAAEVAEGIFGTAAAWQIGIDKASLYPLWQPVASTPAFTGKTYPFVGGQTINKDVFSAAAAGYRGMVYSPFQSLVYEKTGTRLHDAFVSNKTTPSQAADLIQQDIEQYAKQQGFELQ